ncbi:MAG TPA: GTP 3',8-cyclase MoaA [Terriglobia bacterium]|nr:GTP 3',8-cyclase MoaA [Terriglobia bacterium]
MPETSEKLIHPLLDQFRRPLRALRISVTDRCNLRCQYCMPEDEYVWLRREEILHFEEINTLVGIFADLGVNKIRLTGGEPLLRHNLPDLIRLLAANEKLGDLALTTNGLLLSRHARALREAGLKRVTVSLDTLRPERFERLTRSGSHASVLEGIEAARTAGFGRIKINAVVMRGFNDDELVSLIEFGQRTGAEVRFIEYMDVGGATRWSPENVVTCEEMLQILEHRFGPVLPLDSRAPGNGGGASKAPADRFELPDGTRFGIISSTSRPFCRSCDRSRLTTDGIWFLCLYAGRGIDFRALLRGGVPRETIAQTIAEAWEARDDRGAEERRQLHSRGILFPVEELRKDPHREMHTRGG